MTSTAIVGGIDIAKADVVVACRPDGTSWTAPHEAPGITAPVDRVRALVPSLIVREATGGDAPPRVADTAAAGLPVVVAHPRHVRDVATATGPLATTDRLDAPRLALCAERVPPTPRPLPDAARPPREALMTRRRQLVHKGDRRAPSTGSTPAPRSAGPSRHPSAGANAVWRPSIAIGTTPSGRARSGGRKRLFCARVPAAVPS